MATPKYRRRTVTVTREEFIVDTVTPGRPYATGVEIAEALREATKCYRMDKGGAAANLNVDVARAVKIHTNGDEIIIWYEVREEVNDR